MLVRRQFLKRPTSCFWFRLRRVREGRSSIARLPALTAAEYCRSSRTETRLPYRTTTVTRHIISFLCGRTNSNLLLGAPMKTRRLKRDHKELCSAPAVLASALASAQVLGSVLRTSKAQGAACYPFARKPLRRCERNREYRAGKRDDKETCKLSYKEVSGQDAAGGEPTTLNRKPTRRRPCFIGEIASANLVPTNALAAQVRNGPKKALDGEYCLLRVCHGSHQGCFISRLLRKNPRTHASCCPVHSAGQI